MSKEVTAKWRAKNKMTNESEGYPKHASPELKAIIKLWRDAGAEELK